MHIRSIQLLVLLLIVSITATAQEKIFIITGKFAKPTPFKTIKFIKRDNANIGLENERNIEIVNNTFTIDGKITEPTPATLRLGNDSNEVMLFIDEGKTEIRIEDKLSEALITGSKTTNVFRKFLSSDAEFENKFKILSDNADSELASGISRNSVEKNYYSVAYGLNNEYLNFHKYFIAQNKSSFLSLMIIHKLVGITGNYVEADSLFHQLSSEITSLPTAKLISESITNGMKTSIGAIAPDFSLADTTGKMVSLSSLRGKYVLIDFWASWCDPCRQENPNIVSAYQQYKDNGFTVLGVSLDKDKQSWLKAIRNDSLTWTQILDLNYGGSAAAEMYGITAIPRNFLLDPYGKIIAKDLRGPNLLVKLDELLSGATIHKVQ